MASLTVPLTASRPAAWPRDAHMRSAARFSTSTFNRATSSPLTTKKCVERGRTKGTLTTPT